MEEPSVVIDVKGVEKPPERIKKVSVGLDKISSGELAEIIADDERMPQLAPKMIESIEKAEFIKTWKGDDGFYHTLVKKK